MTDTDGILDRCAEPGCGARAEFRGVPSKAYVKCTECANSTDYVCRIVDVMVGWNIAQRAIKAIKERRREYDQQVS